MAEKKDTKCNESQDSRGNTGARQHLGLHGVQPLALAHAELDLHPVVRVVLEEEAAVHHELGVGPRAVEDVDLSRGSAEEKGGFIVRIYDRRQGSELVAYRLTSDNGTSTAVAG